MLKKTINFENLDGEPVTRDYYFHLTRAEIAKLSLTKGGSLGEYIQKMFESGDMAAVIDEVENIVRISVGQRSENRESFLKKPEFTDEFMGSEAYSTLLSEFLTDAGAFPKFVAGVLSADMRDEFNKQFDALGNVENVTNIPFPGLGTVTQPEPPKEIHAPRKPEEYSSFELIDMSDQAFKDLLDSIKGNNVSKNILIAAMQRRSK